MAVEAELHALADRQISEWSRQLNDRKAELATGSSWLGVWGRQRPDWSILLHRSGVRLIGRYVESRLTATGRDATAISLNSSPESGR